MAKITIKGIIESIGELQEVGAKKTLKHSFILMVPGYTDQFGDKKGRDEHWEVTMLGESIDKFNIQDRHKGAKVECELYINSSWYESKTTGNTGCIVNVNLASIKYINQAKKEPVASGPMDFNTTPGEDDDLPF